MLNLEVIESTQYNGAPQVNYPMYPATELLNDDCDGIVASGYTTRTFWVGPEDNNPPATFTLDFGVRVILKKVFLRNSHNHISHDRGTQGFQLEVSEDANTWKVTTTGVLQNPINVACANLPNEPFEVNAVARFLRFEVTSYYDSGPALNRIQFEFSKYDKPDDMFKCLDPSGKCPKIVKSSRYREVLGNELHFPPESVLTDKTCADYGYDPSVATAPAKVYYGPQGNNPEAFIIFDLGGQVTINSVVIRNGRGNDAYAGSVRAAKDFVIQVSDDLKIWTQVLSATLTNTLILPSCSQVQPETFPLSATGRYVQLRVTNYYGTQGVALNYVNFDYEVPQDAFKCLPDQICPSE